LPRNRCGKSGRTVEETVSNLDEAVSLFFETADPSEITRRRRSEFFVTQVEVELGRTPGFGWTRSVRNSCPKRIFRSAVPRQPHRYARRIQQSTITVPVPDHDELRVGTLASIIRQSQLSANLSCLRSLFES